MFIEFHTVLHDVTFLQHPETECFSCCASKAETLQYSAQNIRQNSKHKHYEIIRPIMMVEKLSVTKFFEPKFEMKDFQMLFKTYILVSNDNLSRYMMYAFRIEKKL